MAHDIEANATNANAIYIGGGKGSNSKTGNGSLQPKKDSTTNALTSQFYNMGAPSMTNGQATISDGTESGANPKKNQMDSMLTKFAASGNKRDIAQTATSNDDKNSYRDVNFNNRVGYTTQFNESKDVSNYSGSGALDETATYNKGVRSGATYAEAMSKLSVSGAISRAEYVEGNGSAGFTAGTNDFKARNASAAEINGGGATATIDVPRSAGSFTYNAGIGTSAANESGKTATVWTDANNNKAEDSGEVATIKYNKERGNEINKIYMAGAVSAMTSR